MSLELTPTLLKYSFSLVLSIWSMIFFWSICFFYSSWMALARTILSSRTLSRSSLNFLKFSWTMAFHFSSETFNYAAGSSYTKYFVLYPGTSPDLANPFEALTDLEDLCDRASMLGGQSLILLVVSGYG